jgi:hypothetical protein
VLSTNLPGALASLAVSKAGIRDGTAVFGVAVAVAI